MRRFLPFICLVLLLATGCAKPGLKNSYCGPLPEQQAVSSIATDAVNFLAELFAPGHTSVHVLPAKDASNGFASAFENTLRARGFTVAASQGADIVVVAYTLDALVEDGEKVAWYLQLRLSDGKVIARSYTANGQPEAGQSRTEQAFRGSTAARAAEKVRHAVDSGMDSFQ